MKTSAAIWLCTTMLLVGCGDSVTTTPATQNTTDNTTQPTNDGHSTDPVAPVTTPFEPMGANPELPGPVTDLDSDGDGVIDEDDEFPNDASRAMSLSSAHRLSLQTTFGPTPEDLSRVQSIGAERWVDEQLNAPSAYDSATDNHRTHLQRTIEIAQHIEPNTTWYGSGIFNHDEASFSVDEYQMAAEVFILSPEHEIVPIGLLFF